MALRKHPPHRDVVLLLEHGLTDVQRQLNRRLIDYVSVRFREHLRSLRRRERRAARDVPRHARKKWWADQRVDRRKPENSNWRLLVDCLRLEIDQQLARLTELRTRHADLRKELSRAINREEAEGILLDHGRELSNHWWQSWGDRKARKRWLSEEAIHDRYDRREGEAQQVLTFCLNRLGVVMRHLGSLVTRPMEQVDLWQRLSIVPIVQQVFATPLDPRVHRAGWLCLYDGLRDAVTQVVQAVIPPALQVLVQETSLDSGKDVWVQCAAMDLLSVAAPDLYRSFLRQRLTQPLDGDDFFVRRYCLKLVSKQANLFAHDEWFWVQLLKDPSEAVRQQLAQCLWGCENASVGRWLERLLQQDTSPSVRASVLVSGLQHVDHRDWPRWLLHMIVETLETDEDPFVQRTALWVATEWLQRRLTLERASGLSDERRSTALESLLSIYEQEIVPAIRFLKNHATHLPARRWATEAGERIWVLLHPKARELKEHLTELSRTIPPGGSRRISKDLLAGYDMDVVGRTMAVVTQDDFGLEVENGLWWDRLVRTPRFGWRAWRVWHEFWHPATDKRQAHRHTVGRVSRSSLKAPSRIMAELSQTKVPGEPLVMPDDGTWRPFLPLPDDFVSHLHQSTIRPHVTRVYSSEGVTEIQSPPSIWRRAWASLRLMLQFPKVADLRNWQESSGSRPDKYLQTFQDMGFQIRFRPHILEATQDGASRSAPSDEDAVDSTVTQFFPALLAISVPALTPRVAAWIDEYVYYFGSAFENNLQQLMLFTCFCLGAFLLHHALSNFRVARARRSLPLVIGGWGTRGKSGTERLKAALLTGLGHGIVSKTTGCEAMFIQGHAFGQPLEVPLYRPNDKATIWEHANLIRFAAGIRPSSFLWECMGLTPAYVNVLQRQWTQDDISTITNTYPDHEDIQGPSGLDVATTIVGFVPYRSKLITSEQQMRPLVRYACEKMKTAFRSVGWLESGMIPSDMLARFPYREHPDNIALVAALADELGCDYDEAIKAMADHLIADLGVLKTHPVARVQTREIEFSNGMSANERFGCLGNWQRLHFDRQDPRAEPGVWLSTVVNNRADRVARSRVFADVVVNDLRADRHFLIGGNLKGLQGFISEAWDAYAAKVSLVREGASWDEAFASQRLQELADRFRVPSTLEDIRNRVAPMLRAALPAWSDEQIATLRDECLQNVATLAKRLEEQGVEASIAQNVQDRLTEWKTAQVEYARLQESIQGQRGENHTALEHTLKETLRDWFLRKLVVIENYYATGDQVIQRIVDETPAGYRNRVMGIQNIKGTGLDFVYRFHAWDRAHQACKLLSQRETEPRTQGLQILLSMPHFGVLCQEAIRDALASLKSSSAPVTSEMQLLVNTIQQQLDRDLAGLRSASAGDGSSSSNAAWWKPLVGWLEQWMEIHDSVRRRQAADRIYRDLQTERIGRHQAIEELRLLNKRQKGGWLFAQKTP